jgi:hypothetical protein
MKQIYIDHINKCFELAEKGKSKIDTYIKTWTDHTEGMTGLKTRHFYNNLLSFDDSRYLEIGTYAGSSACSALCGNKAVATIIDNFSYIDNDGNLMPHIKEQFLKNFTKYKGDNQANFIEADCFSLNVNELGKYNIYLYDGDHSRDAHHDALKHFLPVLDDTFIFIVDDWNWADVRSGTFSAIENLNLTIDAKWEIKLTDNDMHTPDTETARATWHNGIFVSVLTKSKI